jgi:hypothetical protein
MTAYLPWTLALIALGFFVHACRALAADAKAGYDVGTGAAGLFTGEWMIGAVSGALGLTLALQLAWYWGATIFGVLVLLKGPAYDLIVNPAEKIEQDRDAP